MQARLIVASIIRAASKLDFKVIIVPKSATVEDKLRPFCQTVWDVDMLPRVFAVYVDCGLISIISIVGKPFIFDVKEEVDVATQLTTYLAYLQTLKERLRVVIDMAKLDDSTCQIWPMSTCDRPLVSPTRDGCKGSYAIIVKGMASETGNGYAEYDDIFVKGHTNCISMTKIIPVQVGITDIKLMINMFMIAMRYKSDPMNPSDVAHVI
jgi:hypothetical protein